MGCNEKAKLCETHGMMLCKLLHNIQQFVDALRFRS